MSGIRRFIRQFKSHLFLKIIQVVSLTLGYTVFLVLFSLAISASLANKLYGSTDLGKELRLNEGWVFYISTVLEDIPEESHLNFDVLISLPSLLYYMRNFDNLTGQLADNEDFEYVELPVA